MASHFSHIGSVIPASIMRCSIFGHLQPLFGELQPIFLVHAIGRLFSGVPAFFRLATVAIGGELFGHLNYKPRRATGVPADAIRPWTANSGAEALVGPVNAPSLAPVRNQLDKRFARLARCGLSTLHCAKICSHVHVPDCPHPAEVGVT